MSSIDIALSPPQSLAVVYARSDLRSGFSLLLAFDARLADIVGRTGEPMIAQMKFAWWYDAISRDAVNRPKGEPMLLALNKLSVPGVDAAVLQLLDAWSILLAADDWTAELVARFASSRSAAIFITYTSWMRQDVDVSEMGMDWATADLKQRFGAKVLCSQNEKKPTVRTIRQLRPLSILALSVTNPSAGKMLWHVLTGR